MQYSYRGLRLDVGEARKEAAGRIEVVAFMVPLIFGIFAAKDLMALSVARAACRLRLEPKRKPS